MPVYRLAGLSLCWISLRKTNSKVGFVGNYKSYTDSLCMIIWVWHLVQTDTLGTSDLVFSSIHLAVNLDNGVQLQQLAHWCEKKIF